MKQCGCCKEQLPETLIYFSKNTKGRNGYRSICRQCDKMKRLLSYNRDRKKINKYHKAYRNFADGYYSYRNYIYTTYKVREDVIRNLMDEQMGCCAICGKSLVNPNWRKGDMHIDHCHTTGEIRGLLCCNCNHLIGVCLEDKAILKKAMEYLV